VWTCLQDIPYTYHCVYYETGPSTKDLAHLRRSGSVLDTNVKFDGNMLIKLKKENFPNNKGNKQRFVNMLSEYLQAAG